MDCVRNGNVESTCHCSLTCAVARGSSSQLRGCRTPRGCNRFEAKHIKKIAHFENRTAHVKGTSSPKVQGTDMADQMYEPPYRVRENAHLKCRAQYNQLYERSINDPEGFWKQLSESFYWKESVKGKVFDYNINVYKGSVFVKFMEGAKTNIAYNCLDVHVQGGSADNVAYFWEGNDPEDTKTLTYGQLLQQVCRMANVLRAKGVKKGDRVAIYMPMIPELVVTMLACARIGAIHSIVFAGFSADAFAERVVDARAKVVVTCDGVWRGNKLINLKKIVEEAIDKASLVAHEVESCIVVRHLSPAPDSTALSIEGKRPYGPFKVSLSPISSWYHDEVAKHKDICEPEWVDSEDPLFLLYTSGSTGKPKGIVHTTSGYMVYTATTFKFVFDYRKGDVYFCTADIGWITGHSYVCYGPLLNGAISVLFEGTPFYPNGSRLWQIVDKYRVTQFYTAPTAIRALMKEGDSLVSSTSKRQTLRILGTVGEPINPEAWLWYHRIVGNENCAIVDTFWQTETGGHVITPIPGAIATKPGSATLPFFGVEAVILDEQGKEIKDTTEGYLVFKRPWPSIMRTIFGDHERFETTYFKKFPGYYCTGDGGRRDADGYIWVTGRMDDMLNVSGHLLSTAEVESALIEHEAIAEAAAVAAPHPVKGECLYCFVTLKEGYEYTETTAQRLREKVRERIGPFAAPDVIHACPVLPKTRSGKIMRRILRNVAANNRTFGDLSTLADEGVIETLFATRPATAPTLVPAKSKEQNTSSSSNAARSY
ncbi:acetyl-coenzyme A synthetase-like [Varroa jacobsoni]|uniref:acetyl-coenzyme A synthetase-like n=1 Tax=Varroa jacobsoni TaxID=62625 RepID=UPI000BF5237B|nr:acetyl-coenzyme A synthetase-like [Varroa jacobsoni]